MDPPGAWPGDGRLRQRHTRPSPGPSASRRPSPWPA